MTLATSVEIPQDIHRVPARHFLVHRQPQAGHIAQGDMPIYYEGPLFHQVIPELLVEMVELQNEEIGHGGARVAGRLGADGTADIVRRQRHVIHVGQIGDALAFG